MSNSELRLKRRKLLSVTIAAAFLFTTILALDAISLSDGTRSLAPRDKPDIEMIQARMLALAPHDPIFIDGNAGFDGPNSSTGVARGSGTVDDPYVIEGWDISATTAHGIAIQYTSSHFTVRNCYVHNGGVTYSGIILLGCTNGTVTGDTCSNNDDGIRLSSSSNNTLSGNNCSNNDDGIVLGSSSNNTLSGNNCLNNGYGICLSSSSNNTLSGNNCSDNDYGIYLDSSRNNNTLSGNHCSNNLEGIHLTSSSNNALSGNNCSSNSYWGIYLIYSSNNALSGNNCSSNDYHGMWLIWSSNNALSDNNCSYNNRWGMQLVYSYRNVMLRNQLCGNLQYGMYIHSPSSSNIVFNNTFIDNNGAGSTYDLDHVQACDDGTNNWWNSTEGYGNYWSDWTTPDVVPPCGIVDQPYVVDGSAGAEDSYPQTSPLAPIPEFSMMPFVAMVLLVAILLSRSRKKP